MESKRHLDVVMCPEFVMYRRDPYVYYIPNVYWVYSYVLQMYLHKFMTPTCVIFIKTEKNVSCSLIINQKD